MNRIVVTTMVSNDGSLRLNLPLGADEAGKEVQVTVETVPARLSQEAWRKLVLSTAGTWQGDFERPEQGAYEEREPLS